MSSNFDLLVIGGGSAGFAAAVRGAELGARVGLVEAGALGGTCVNVGCVPSKTLIRAAEARQRRSGHAFAGVPSGDGAPDWTLVRGQKDELVSRLREAKYADVLRSYEGVELFARRGVLRPGPAIGLEDGRTLRAPKIVITTGSSPWAPPIPGLDGVEYLDSASAMALDRLPRSLAVIGGSAVGLELAQTFSRLGARVSVLEAMPRLVPAEDPRIGEALADYLRGEGIDIYTDAAIRRVRSESGVIVDFEADGQPKALRAEQLLVAAGRRANTRGLSLQAAGIGIGARGEIQVDEYLRTTNPDVFAAGDVIGEPMFVYVAARAGLTVAENALGAGVRSYDLTAVPRVTFTDPAVASVGTSAPDAAAAGHPVIEAELFMEHVPRALAARDTRGLVRLVADAATRRLLGAHILAAEAGEMIMEPALAIRFGLTIDNLASTLHPYLTLSEGIKLAAQTFDKDVAKLSCCAV